MAISLLTSRPVGRAGTAALLAALVLPVAPAAAQPPPARQQSVCAPHGDLRQALRTLTDRDRITGAAVLITDPNEGLPCGSWAASVGTADLSTGRPMNVTDRLRAGSVTKTFTATVVLQLAAEHRISLDEPVDRYLPGLVRHNGYDGRRITVRQLLRHTSGLPDYLEAPEWEHPERLRYRHFEPRELVTRALDLPRPSGSWHYATTNYLLAGMIIREVTGHAPEAEITRRVIRPLGLRDTYWPGDDTRIRGRHSRSYFASEDGRLADGTAWNTTFGGVGGALVSTPADLTRFVTALFGGRLLPADQLADMRRTVAADPDRLWPGARYGLGLITSPLRCGGLWWGHAGTVPGGHRALTAVGPGGRSVAVALNEVPATLQAEQDFLDLVGTAFCEDPPSRATPPIEGNHQ
ncbi:MULTISPECIES: serine hydrolase domain-containing protein [unclassified Streptomyces]|uniref:serine hydrolase domain-containing protein n=1 Tax=unclassified Streptomyces TaxID=2593676 RepID=UPI001BB04744|nr:MULTISPECIES: serine hydrolase domain-containing protein [unclassified Streptomyces]MDH6455310.1 D-alanyl-D-alanine carboxypeptidase [Streptomyces sp. SAI-119]MDH6494137.1 D-alanyl-D-alanine carboxypeptidase [Streptomyces sp. SAI-149]QUC58676.1 beta-lactamase family protein [Streptomyces sp. A2-16]